jgi:hypothetical protein
MIHKNKTINEKLQALITDGILDVIGDGVSIQDKNLKVLYQNRVHRNLFGNHVGDTAIKRMKGETPFMKAVPSIWLLRTA